MIQEAFAHALRNTPVQEVSTVYSWWWVGVPFAVFIVTFFFWITQSK